MRFRFFLTGSILLWLALGVQSQTAPKGFSQSPFQPQSGVQLIAYIEQEPGLVGQRVWWAAKNLTNDKLEIKFVKVIHTTCGTTIRDDADTYLDPGKTVVGSTFSGELTFETQVTKDLCNNPKNRIRSVGYERLVIKNLSEEERKAEEKKAAQEKNKANVSSAAGNNQAGGGYNTNRSAGSTTSSGTSNNTATANSTYQQGRNQQADYQAEQQRLAQQQQQEVRQRQEAYKRMQEDYERQLNDISQKSMARAEQSQSVMDGLGSIFSTIQANQVRKSLEATQRERREAIKNLGEKVKSGQYELENCSRCYGQGFKSCRKCNATGKEKCNVCFGRAGQACSNCNGTGTKDWGPYRLACTSCNGKGKKTCMGCENSGQSICSTCDGTGDDQCNGCQGTGKIAVARTTPAYTQSATQGLASTNSTDNNNYSNYSAPTKSTAPPPMVDPNVLAFEREQKRDSLILAPVLNLEQVELMEAKSDSVYAIAYEREYKKGVRSTITLTTHVVYRKPDGYFPFSEDLRLDREYLLSEEDVYRFLGFFSTYSQFKNALTQIESQAKKLSITVKKNPKINKINTYSRKKLTTEEFWNEISLY